MDNVAFYIYILNYNTGKIQCIMCEEEDRETPVEDIIDKHGLKESEVSWMVSDECLSIEFCL